MNLVAESLDEHLDEGKFGKGLAMAGMAAGLALSPMQKANAQTAPQQDKNKTEISSETKSLTPILRNVMSVEEKDGNYVIKVESKSRDMNTIRRIAQMTANSEALHQKHPGEQSVQGNIKGSQITDSEMFREGNIYVGEITVTIPISGIQ